MNRGWLKKLSDKELVDLYEKRKSKVNQLMREMDDLDGDIEALQARKKTVKGILTKAIGKFNTAENVFLARANQKKED